MHLYTHIRDVCNKVYSPEKRSSPLVRVDAFSDKNLTGGFVTAQHNAPPRTVKVVAPSV